MEELKYRCTLVSPTGGFIEKILTEQELNLLEFEG